MKTLALVLAFCTSSAAFAARKMIDYHYYNQITASTLKIYDDGRVQRWERTCCPPKENEVSEAQLSPETLNQLRAAIVRASQSAVRTFQFGSSGHGSSSGYLVAYHPDGYDFIIRHIDYGDGNGGPQTVYYNIAEESRFVEKLVFERVSQKMSH